MKRVVYSLLAVSAIALSSGCQTIGKSTQQAMANPVQQASFAGCGCLAGSCNDCPTGCDSENCGIGCSGCAGCDPTTSCGGILGKLGLCIGNGALAIHSTKHCRGVGCGLADGPTMGAVTYPYYTVRGPRDFLAARPPSIGP